MSDPIVRRALEWWRASGPKSLTRLRALVDHECQHAGLVRPRDNETIRNLYDEAEGSVQPWDAASV